MMISGQFANSSSLKNISLNINVIEGKQMYHELRSLNVKIVELEDF